MDRELKQGVLVGPLGTGVQAMIIVMSWNSENSSDLGSLYQYSR